MSRTRSSLALNWAVSVALLISSGCRPATPLRIAVVGADGAIDGASLAAADINAAGGINGRPIELVFVPELSGSSVRDAIATAELLADGR